MFLDLGWIVNLMLIIIGSIWCWLILSNLRKDMVQFKKTKDGSRRRAIIIFWTVTTAIMILIINFSLALIGNISKAF